MLKDFKEMLKSPELKCTNCGKKINEGDSFTANLILPSIPISKSPECKTYSFEYSPQ